ncbi:amidase-like protein [Coniochaeta sp. 2T2.1]|nr:amidase-like protein [Coniochaeta sp. 2T2.1]
MDKPRNLILQYSALELQERLTFGDLTTVALVQICLDQIELHNRRGFKLKAVISVDSTRQKVIARAELLDEERKQGKLRSRVHGIPIIVKDAIVTDLSLEMPTTVGSHVFSHLKAKKNATLVDKLLGAGLIILGKANMTEFCGLKGNEPIGWSSVMGQTLSPYRREDLPEGQQPISGGSSSGSAVSVAADFSPLAVGTETAGSTVLPASCNGLYAMKLTPGTVPTDGVFCLSESFDGIGVMARNPADLAALAEVLLARDGDGVHGLGTYPGTTTAVDGSLSRLAIGVVANTWGLYDKEKWTSADVVASYENVVDLLRARGARVVYPLEAPDHETLKDKGETLTTVAYAEFPAQVEQFITNFKENPRIKNLADIIKWNEEHADIALPEPHSSQSELIKALNSKMTERTRLETVAALRTLAGPQGIGKVMAEHDLDIILAPSDSTLVSFAACAGWPIATVPLSRLEKNGQPYGFFVVARDGRQDLLFKFMGGYHKAFPEAERPCRPFEEGAEEFFAD